MQGFEDIDDALDLFDDAIRPMSKRERTRLKIMASAAKVFSEKGFDRTSIQDIADDAGIAKGTIYYYVEKKEDLILSLVRFGQDRFFTKVEKGIEKAETASKKIEFIIRNHVKIVKTVGPVIPFFAQSLMAEDSRIRNTMAKFRERYLGLLESVIKDGIRTGEFRPVNPERMAFTILSLVIGQFLQSKVFIGTISVNEIVENTMDLSVSGLRSRNED